MIGKENAKERLIEIYIQSSVAKMEVGGGSIYVFGISR